MSRFCLFLSLLVCNMYMLKVLEQVSPKPSEVITVTAQTFPEKNRSMEFLPSEHSHHIYMYTNTDITLI